MKTLVSICICTYKRDFVINSIKTLIKQKLSDNYFFELIIIDNDQQASAKHKIKELLFTTNISYRYAIETKQNIACARNLALSIAQGKWIAFVDDDEVADEIWLQTLLDCAHQYKADIVFGSVLPHYPENTPYWLKKGDFFYRSRPETGTSVSFGGTGNILLHSSSICKFEKFNEKFGLSGGEDTEFSYRMHLNGLKLIFCKEAIVYEYIETNRVNAKYLLKRAFRGGETYIKIIGEHFTLGNKIKLLIKTLAATILFSLLTICLCFLGKYYSMPYAIRLYQQLGKLKQFLFNSKLSQNYANS